MPEPTQKQKEKIKHLAFESMHYGLQTQLDQNQADIYFGETSKQEEKDAVAVRIKELFMVDTQTAEELKDAFPDLYKAAQDEKKLLQTRANASGIRKAKEAILGNRHKKAKKKLDQIEEDSQKLWSERRAFDADAVHYTEKSTEMDGKLEERKRAIQTELATATGLRKRMLEKGLGYCDDQGGNANSVAEKLDRYEKASPYALKLSEAEERMFEFTPMRQLDGHFSRLPSDNLYRDVARFTTPFYHADQADPAVMLEAAKNMQIAVYGSKLDAQYVPKQVNGNTIMVQEQATLQEKKAAFLSSTQYLEMAYADMKQFEQDHARIFVDRPEAETILDDYEALNEMYKKSQVVDYVAGKMVKSEYFLRDSAEADGLSLTKEQKEHIQELRDYLAYMNKYVQAVMAKFKSWSQFFGKTPGSKMPVWLPEQTCSAIKAKYKVS